MDKWYMTNAGHWFWTALPAELCRVWRPTPAFCLGDSGSVNTSTKTGTVMIDSVNTHMRGHSTEAAIRKGTQSMSTSKLSTTS